MKLHPICVLPVAVAGFAFAPAGAKAQDGPAQSINERAQRRAANSDQARLSRAQLAQNAANRADYEARLARYDSQMRLYDNHVESHARAAAEYAQIKQIYDMIFEQWQADVAACASGDRQRCARPNIPAAP